MTRARVVATGSSHRLVDTNGERIRYTLERRRHDAVGAEYWAPVMEDINPAGDAVVDGLVALLEEVVSR